MDNSEIRKHKDLAILREGAFSSWRDELQEDHPFVDVMPSSAQKQKDAEKKMKEMKKAKKEERAMAEGNLVEKTGPLEKDEKSRKDHDLATQRERKSERGKQLKGDPDFEGAREKESVRQGRRLPNPSFDELVRRTGDKPRARKPTEQIKGVKRPGTMKKEETEIQEDKTVDKVATELEGAVKMHASQAKRLRKHSKEMKEEKKNCGCGKDPCITYGKQAKTQKEETMDPQTFADAYAAMYQIDEQGRATAAARQRSRERAAAKPDTSKRNPLTDYDAGAISDKLKTDRPRNPLTDYDAGAITKALQTDTKVPPKTEPVKPQTVKPAAAPAAAKPAAKPAAPARDRMAGASKADRMSAWAKANPKLAAKQAERTRTRGTTSSSNPMMKGLATRSAKPATPAKPASSSMLNNKGVNTSMSVSKPAAAPKPAASAAPKPAATPAKSSPISSSRLSSALSSVKPVSKS